jgi:nucleoside 2-deoxyribosyltransferase
VRVYLAGPINGCGDAQALDWRNLAADELAHAGIEPVDPFSLGDYRGREGTVDAAMIVNNDLIAIASCDMVLANCWRPSYGTAMEIAIAQREHGIAVITVVPDVRKVSPWLRAHSTRVTGSLREGLNIIRRAR